MVYFSAKKKPEISLPTQFEHTLHVGFDPVTGDFTVWSFINFRFRNTYSYLFHKKAILRNCANSHGNGGYYGKLQVFA